MYIYIYIYISRDIYPLYPDGGLYIYTYRSEGFAIMGDVVPGCLEDGAWML